MSDFVDAESMVLSDQYETSGELRACEHHLVRIRGAVARELWSRRFFVGVTVLDELLFHAVARSETSNPILEVLEQVRDLGLHRPGFALYPLHSMGVLGAGFAQTLAGRYPSFYHPRHGFLLTPQTNSLDRTLRFLDDAAESLGVRKSPPQELIQHWYLSRSAYWLERNPLLALRVHSFPGTYYENQYFLVVRLNLTKTLILMLSALEERVPETSLGFLASSARVNNFETLDIRHYLVFYPRPGSSKVLAGDCVPMNGPAATLAEISALPVELDPRYWRRRPGLADRLSRGLRTVEAMYVDRALKGTRDRVRARVARKLYRSLDFFRRSFRRGGDSADATINLAIAFEVLLVDCYAPGVGEKIRKRARLALRGVKGTRRLQNAIEGLYDARSSFVHSGDSTAGVDLPAAQETFVHAFLGVVGRLGHLPRTSSQPIGDVLGDN